MYTLENEHLKLRIQQKGAELTSIISQKNNKEYLWQGDAAYWSGQSPVLFPFIGCLKEGEFTFEGKTYTHPKHGFFRKYTDVNCVLHEKDQIIFEIESNEKLKENYPFDYIFRVSYHLVGNQIEVRHKVINKDHKPMYFSLGAHPAFNCSIQDKNSKHDSCSLVFEKKETEPTWDVNLANGLIKSSSRPSLINQNTLALKEGIFDADALIYKNLKSKKVSLRNNLEGNLVTVDYKDFDYIAFWAVPNAPYVCIEPWLGIADSEAHDKNLVDKEGIIQLNGLDDFEAAYQITIHH